ncbi:hypothetical protein Sj15T_36100 [Sphingobium sp. TA15]|uniref:Xre-family transcriptional regulator n=1 Tax=Sphingobium indicum (strain DSM 16413 / CCM 7287 / MTCC 6362 / UT26 / NBRC 101211 / UT26S) TaxID=452662 RepID=D4Z7R5_SPHIU|nr:helix-turn-helix domain-containing protein [Sphingobium indicum]BAI98534.1 Xre-family transcriptional regulator [Sphingobium indicum UT26S]BDD68589.1 hypothetical protein Sj15T_36100 [Sphingobium sp. TA15]
MPISAIVDQPPETDNRRGAARWRIRLELPGTSGDADANLVIHDISTAGMLIETRSTLEIGQGVMLSLPDADEVVARVVWQNDTLFGCRFETALPQGVVSAIRLRHPGRDAMQTAGDRPEGAADEGLGERLLRLRHEKGMSRTALSERTGFSKPTIWGWETGRTTPRRENLRILSAVFGLTEQQLLYGKGRSTLRETDGSGPESYTRSLKEVIDQSKTRIAEAAGVSKLKVNISIEF